MSVLLLDELFQFRPSGVPRLDVGPVRRRLRGRVLAAAHEAVAGAFVDYRVVGLAGRFHLLFRGLDGRGDTGVVAAVEAVDRRLDASERGVVRRRTVENERSLQVGAIGGVAETLTAAVAEAG